MLLFYEIFIYETFLNIVGKQTSVRSSRSYREQIMIEELEECP